MKVSVLTWIAILWFSRLASSHCQWNAKRWRWWWYSSLLIWLCMVLWRWWWYWNSESILSHNDSGLPILVYFLWMPMLWFFFNGCDLHILLSWGQQMPQGGPYVLRLNFSGKLISVITKPTQEATMPKGEQQSSSFLYFFLFGSCSIWTFFFVFFLLLFFLHVFIFLFIYAFPFIFHYQLFFFPFLFF